MVSVTSPEIFTDYARELTLRGASAILELQLRKNVLLFARTSVIFKISVSFSTRYQI